MAKTKIYFSEKYKVLPEATAREGQIIQYFGEDTETCKNGYFYKAINGEWVASDTQSYPIVDKKTLMRARNASESTRMEENGIGLIMWCPEMTPNLKPGSVITAISLDSVENKDVASGNFRMVLWSNDGGDHDSSHNKLIGWSKDLNPLTKGELKSTTWTFANVVVPNTFKRLIVQLEPENISVDTIKEFVWGTQNTYPNLSVVYDEIKGDDGNQFINEKRTAYKWGVVARGSVTSYATSVVGQSDIDTAVTHESDLRVAGDKVFTNWRDNNAIILGNNASVSGVAIAIGKNVAALSGGIAIGYALSAEPSGILLGNESNAENNSIVIGNLSFGGETNVVIGNGTSTSFSESSASGIINENTNSVAIGSEAYAPSGNYVFGTTSTPESFYFNSKCKYDSESKSLKPVTGSYTLDEYVTNRLSKTAILSGVNYNKPFSIQKYTQHVEFNDTNPNIAFDKVRYFEVPVNHSVDSRLVQLAIYGGVDISYTDPIRLVLWEYDGSGTIDDATCKYIGYSENSVSIKSYYGAVFYFDTIKYGTLLRANHKLIVQGVPDSETPNESWKWSEKCNSFEHLSIIGRYDSTQTDDTLKGWSVYDVDGVIDYARPCGVFGFFVTEGVSVDIASVNITTVDDADYSSNIDALNRSLIVNGTGIGTILHKELLDNHSINDFVIKGENNGNPTIKLSTKPTDGDITNENEYLCSALAASGINFYNSNSSNNTATISTIDEQYKSYGAGVGTVVSNHVLSSLSREYTFGSGSSKNGSTLYFGISSNLLTDSVINDISINAPATVSYDQPIKLVLWSHDGSGTYSDDTMTYIGCSTMSASLTANSATTYLFDGIVLETGRNLVVQGINMTETPDSTWKWSDQLSKQSVISVKYSNDIDILNTLGSTSGYLVDCSITATPKTDQIINSIPTATDDSYGVIKTDGINSALTALAHEYTFGSHGKSGDRFACVKYAILSIPNTYTFAGGIIRSISVMASTEVSVDNVKKMVIWETTNPYSLNDTTVKYVGVSTNTNRQVPNSFSTWNFENLRISRGSAIIIQTVNETVIPNNTWKWSEREDLYKSLSCRSEADTGSNGNVVYSIDSSHFNHIIYSRICVVKDTVPEINMIELVRNAIGSSNQEFGSEGSNELNNSCYFILSPDNSLTFANRPIYSITITSGSDVANDVFKKLVIWECSDTSNLSNVTCKPLGVSIDIHKQIASSQTTWKFSGEILSSGKALVIQGVDASVDFDRTWTWNSRNTLYKTLSIKYLSSSATDGNIINSGDTSVNGTVECVINTIGVSSQQSNVAVMTDNYLTTDESGYVLTIN